MSGSGDPSRHSRQAASPCAPPDIAARRPDNRAGLTAVAYRISEHGGFVARMLHALPRQTVTNERTGQQDQPLRRLTTRAPDDPTLALIDAFGCTLDVLTFYQERIANEGYVRTASERMSVLELARTIDYELRPGVAASASLAFVVESADDPFRVVEVPVGTQVMSIPAEPTERPQVFETLEAILARAEWNAIPARTERPQNIAMWWRSDTHEKRGSLYLLDVDGSFDLSSVAQSDLITIDADNAGEFYPVTPGLSIDETLAGLAEHHARNPEGPVVIRGVVVEEAQLRGLGFGLAVGRRMLVVGTREKDDGKQAVKTFVYEIAAVSEDADHALTRAELRRIGVDPEPRPPFEIHFLTAPLPIGQIALKPIAFNTATASAFVQRASWSSRDLAAFVQMQAWPRAQLMTLFRQPPPPPPPKLGETRPGFYVLRQKVGFFGNSAPKYDSLAEPAKHGYEKRWDVDNGPSIWTDSQSEPPLSRDPFLEREVAEVVPEGWAVFEIPTGKTAVYRIARAATRSVADFAMSGKATELRLTTPEGTALADRPEDFGFRITSAHLDSQPLPLGGLPIVDAIPAGSREITLDGLYLDLHPGIAVSIVGERSDAAGLEDGETCIVEDVTHVGGFTRLLARDGLVYSYRRTSLRVNANVAGATHGERTQDVLGSGDARLANQAFKLAKPPLTFVSAATDSGARTTLELRVEGILWREAESLHDAGPDDAVYVVRVDDDGTTRVVFGDGVHGRRLPTGAFNVVASYRSGMGLEGEVAEESLTLLKTRPLGIAGVTNRLAARGAAAAETLEEARERAPQSVRTLGRIVSLTDYEDFARSFAGIGKARATSLRRGRSGIVHLTVAPAVEGVFAPADATLANLADAIERRRDPGFALVVAPHIRRLFQIEAKVGFDPRFRAENVEAAIRARLSAAFGYEAARLGDSVSAAAVISVVHTTAGVVFVDLDAMGLYQDDQGGAGVHIAAVLGGRAARVAAPPDEPAIEAAELLTIFPAGVVLHMEEADV